MSFILQSPKCPSFGLTPKFCMASSNVRKVKKPFSPRREVLVQKTHSMPKLLVLLKPDSYEFYDQVEELRERAKELSDDYFVALIGDMITEEALPTYQTMLNTLDGVRDETGASLSPWALWNRAWTAEKNRHGDLPKKYLYLSGRVDMRQIEKTIQYVIGSGMDPGTENNPYHGYIYTSFQERATSICHGSTSRLAREHETSTNLIAADEKRHEAAYTKIVEKLFEIDPNGTMLSFADMMRKKITMPAHLMYDGRDDNLFDHLTAVTQRLGVYEIKLKFKNIIKSTKT